MERNNRIYHNTLYQSEIGIYTNTRDSVYGNICKNNIFFQNREYEIAVNTGGERKDNYFVSNNILGAPMRFLAGAINLSQVQAQYPQYFSDNLSLDPGFLDAGKRNFRLRPDSPMLDKAAFLTKTTSRGQGMEISVEDANYFMDGWSVIEADRIQLQGQSRSVSIVAIDYENNVITVDQSVSWGKGYGVSLAYHGSVPDIGAYEYAP